MILNCLLSSATIALLAGLRPLVVPIRVVNAVYIAVVAFICIIADAAQL